MNTIIEYAVTINASDEIINWLNTVGKKAIKTKSITESHLEHIVDYLISSSAPTRLRKMSFKDAKRKADEWTKANQKRGRDIVDTDEDIETVHDFLDGTKIVLLKTKKAYEREGFFMSHCLGGYSVNSDVLMYSYRDANNEPHATFEIQKINNEIVQIKGKGNGPIHPKYIHPILAFLKTVGFDIRPSDMKNLGYYHIDKCHLDFLKKSDAWKQVTMISGEAYAHDQLKDTNTNNSRYGH